MPDESPSGEEFFRMLRNQVEVRDRQPRPNLGRGAKQDEVPQSREASDRLIGRERCKNADTNSMAKKLD